MDMDLDITPVQRVASMLAKGYLYGSHFLPHDALATQKSGRTFLNELKEAGLSNCKAVPPRSTSGSASIGCGRCSRGFLSASPVRAWLGFVEQLSHGSRDLDEPCHDWSSHACDALRLGAEAEAAGMLSRAGSTGTETRGPIRIRTGYRGSTEDSEGRSILDGFFGPQSRNVRIIR